MGRFNLKDEEDFEAVRERAEKLYADIGSVRCPYLNADVAFNAKGIRHLKFKSDAVARPREDQYPRLKLIAYAPEVLKRTRTVQGIWRTKRLEAQKTSSQWKHVLKDVTFYEFLAVLEEENVRIKVIVKEVADGEKHFWSVIPGWKIDTQSSRRIFHTGDPEHD